METFKKFMYSDVIQQSTIIQRRCRMKTRFYLIILVLLVIETTAVLAGGFTRERFERDRYWSRPILRRPPLVMINVNSQRWRTPLVSNRISIPLISDSLTFRKLYLRQDDYNTPFNDRFFREQRQLEALIKSDPLFKGK
jgi:hypothetical protein